MVDEVILETTFLIDLERELIRSEAGPAQSFLDRHSNARLFTTFTVAGEMAAGMPTASRSRWEDFLRPFEVLPCTSDVCWEYGQAYRYLRANGLPVGANDLWIGATGLAFGKPVVTRSTREFARIPRLTVLDYTVGP
ncbi:MAG: type II toxin-antitoxin system VapC family toxin [Gemmatimonadota bacterium]